MPDFNWLSSIIREFRIFRELQTARQIDRNRVSPAKNYYFLKKKTKKNMSKYFVLLATFLGFQTCNSLNKKRKFLPFSVETIHEMNALHPHIHSEQVNYDYEGRKKAGTKLPRAQADTRIIRAGVSLSLRVCVRVCERDRVSLSRGTRGGEGAHTWATVTKSPSCSLSKDKCSLSFFLPWFLNLALRALL